MPRRIFLAGAAGAVGRRLTPLLLQAGHVVIGTTRSSEKWHALQAVGVEPVVVDVFEREALARAVVAAAPDIVIHQLTDLPPGLDPARMAAATAANARLRREGTRNLVDAALAAGVSRLIAQSIAWAYAPGASPYAEEAPLDLAAPGQRAISVGGVAALEAAVLSAPLSGIVLRYGQLYGPGTGIEGAHPAAAVTLHVDAAAHAAAQAVGHGAAGVYNIAEPGGSVTIDKARRELGFDPAFRLPAQEP